MNQTDVLFIRHTDKRQSWQREKNQRMKTDVCFSPPTPVVCHLILSSFLYVCQSIRCICLSSVYKEGRQIQKGSVNHYPLLTP